MRMTPYLVILFFISLNLSLWIINESNVLGVESVIEPYEDPYDIIGNLAHIDVNDIYAGVVPLVATTIIGLITQHLLLGATLGIIMFAVNMFIPIVSWIMTGFPMFLQKIGTPIWIYLPIQALMGLVWFWFILGFFAQRNLER